MKRKAIRAGPSSIAVSLPSKWVKQIGIKAGDEIEVEENGDNLTIGKNKTSTKKDITLDVTGIELDTFPLRMLTSYYLKGYDLIRIKYTNPQSYFTIQNLMNRSFLGFEIFQTEKDECLLKNVAEGINAEYKNNQRAYFFQIKNIINTLVEAIKNKDFNALEHLLILDLNIDRFCYFLRRMLILQGSEGGELPTNSVYYITVAFENISDQCKNIANHIKETGNFPSKSVLAILQKIKEHIDADCELFYKPDYLKLPQIKYKEIEIKKMIYQSIQKEKEEFPVYASLFSMLSFLHSLSEQL